MDKIFANVKEYKGKPAFYINNTPTSPFIYALTDRPSGNKTWETGPKRQIELFTQIGVNLFQVDVSMEDLFDGDILSIDFIKKQVNGIISINTNAKIMLRFHVNPTVYWIENHKDQCVCYAETETLENPYRPALSSYVANDLFPYRRCSFASKIWLEEYSKHVTDILHALESCEEGKYIFALQIANGIYGENHYWGGIRYTPDTSEVMQLYFKEYIKEKYKTNENLKKAYNDKTVSFENISVPGMDRYELDNGIFIDPIKRKKNIDYYTCQHTLVANTIIHFAKIIKNETNNRLLCGCFYGYYFSLFGRSACAGHLSEDIILNSEYIDFLCAPQAYGKSNRTLGGPAISRGLIESARIHNKVWLDEMDQPSHIGTTLGGMLVFNKQDSIYNHRKHILESFIRGGGCWLYDFGRFDTSGWWDDPEYMNENKKIFDLTNKMFDYEYKNNADVLLVYDTKVFMYVSPTSDNDPITDTMMNIFTIEAYKSGCSVETIYLSDLKRVNIEKYKVVVFVNTFNLDDETCLYINNHVKKKCKNVVFFSYPGYINNESFNIENVRKLTGMNIRIQNMALLPKISYCNYLADGDDANIDSLYIEKSAKKYVSSPMFYIDDTVTPLCYYEDGKIAGGEKDGVYYFSLPLTSSARISSLFKHCLCHIYRESKYATLIGGGVVELNSCGEEKGILTLYSGKKIEYTNSENEVSFFDMDNGAKLL